MVSEKAAEMTKDLKADMDERIRNFKETEYSLNRQLNQIKDQFTALQTNQELAHALSPNTDHFSNWRSF